MTRVHHTVTTVFKKQSTAHPPPVLDLLSQCESLLIESRIIAPEIFVSSIIQHVRTNRLPCGSPVAIGVGSIVARTVAETVTTAGRVDDASITGWAF